MHVIKGDRPSVVWNFFFFSAIFSTFVLFSGSLSEGSTYMIQLQDLKYGATFGKNLQETVNLLRKG